MKANPSPKLGFVFSGQGSQWHAMGRELLHRYPVYRNSVLGASVFLRGLGCPWDAIEELSRDEKDTNVNDAEFSQPLCTITQVALVDLLESFGVRPATVVGHSSGEIAAAYAAGALSKYAAWKIAYFRGLLASRLTAPETRSKTQGAMMAVGLSASEAKPYLQQVAAELGCERLVVACVNSPLNVTISGESAHIDHLKTMLDSAPGGAIFARKLRVEVAYHSFQMLEVADEYLQRIGQLHVPTMSGHLPTMVSSVTGTWIPRADLANPEYWVRNLVSPVLFSDALATMAAAAGSTTSKPKLDGSHARAVALTELVEIGPHSVMQGPSREILRSIGKDSVIRYLSALVRKQSAISTVLDLAGRLHCLGHPVRLQQVNALQPSHLKASKAVISNKVLATLPEYPFNHAKSYWVESRLSKAYRFRKNNRHELVGAQAFDWNPLEARWRHFIRLSDMPWVEHHKINGTTLYPASGMLVMALEAVKQLADPEKLLTGFLFRDVTFHSALSLPDGGEAVEVNLHVRPRKDSSEKDAGWHDFRIYKYDPASRSGSGTEWQENCNGSIQLVYAEARAENDQDELGTAKEVQAWKEDRLGRVARAKGVCTQKADPEQLYQQLAASGYNYGPTFQAIKDLTYDDNSMVATVQTYQWARHFEGHDPTTIMPHTVHPTTLDTILHTMLAVYTRGGTQKIATTIPTFVDRMWVSARGGLSAPGAEAVTVCTAGRRLGLRESESSIVVLDAGGKEVLIDVEGFQTTAVAADSVGDEAQQQAKPCYTVDWKPDLSLLSREEFQRFCHDSIPNPDPEPVEWCAELDLLLLATVKRTLTALQGKPVDSLEEYQRKYYDWMQHRMSSLDAQTLARLDDDALVSALAAKLATGNKQAQFYSAVAQDHVNLLADDKRALDLFFTGSLVGNYYSEAILAPCTSRLRAVVDAMAHNNPSLRFIEIGAGTGSMTDQLMKALNTRNNGEEPTTTPRYSRYTYTDLSPSFFSAAKHKYRDQGDRLQFKTLDITKDAETQGFEVGTYDVVVASGVSIFPHRHRAIIIYHLIPNISSLSGSPCHF
jgi:acyl transferase domain-containing protein